MPSAVGEAAVERALLSSGRAAGFLVLKLVSPARGGVPDRILVTPSGMVFVEVKRPGGNLKPRQCPVHAKIRRFGGEVHTVDRVTLVQKLLHELAQRPAHGRPRTLPPPPPQRLHLKEGTIERRLLEGCRQGHMLCLKFISPARGGVPDRILVTPTGTVFVELKRPRGDLEPRQRAVHAKIRRFGGEVFTINDPSEADWLVKHLSQRTTLGQMQGHRGAAVPLS